MSKQFPLPHPQTTPLPRCSFPLASFVPHIWRLSSLGGTGKEPTVQCEHSYASGSCHSFQVQAVWCQVINLYLTAPISGRPQQMHRPLSSEQKKRDWINYVITYCQPVMNFTWGNDKIKKNKIKTQLSALVDPFCNLFPTVLIGCDCAQSCTPVVSIQRCVCLHG